MITTRVTLPARSQAVDWETLRVAYTDPLFHPSRKTLAVPAAYSL